MSFKLALVQPLSHRPPDDAENVTDAVRFVEQAAALGAQVVTFPESYPGPWRMPATFDAHERLGARHCASSHPFHRTLPGFGRKLVG